MKPDPFIEWLQERLNAHGAKIAADGILGNETTAALKRFQSKCGLKQTGIAYQETVEALRKHPGSGEKLGEVLASPAPCEDLPPWLVEMRRRMGLHEQRDNGALSRWLRIGKFLGNPARLPWCGDAVETCIVKTLPDEPVPENPFWAQAWKAFGIDVKDPIVGAIGVIRWSAKAGHVGIVCGYDRRRNRVSLMGGNQQNAVTISSFPLAKFIAFRWPKSFPVKHYARLSAHGGPAADYAGTR